MDKFLASLVMVSMAFCGAPVYAAGATATDLNVKTAFQKYDGTFVLLDTKSGTVYRFNEGRAAMRLSPCSTFKIFNSLVGLETGVLSGKDHLMKWDGTEYSIASWNGDQTLQSAISNSVVWYFQRVARSIGPQRMQKFVDLVGYGNRDISGGIDKFWLGNSLTISADEQVDFLRRLCDGNLPFADSTMNLVKQMIGLKKTDAGVLHGKTGTDQVEGRNVLGWFVGYVEQPNRCYVFATNISARDGADGAKAREITEHLLKQRGIL